MITELADQNGDGIMTLEELAEYLHVSMATVRRDVDELASRGVLQKTRGGVILQAREAASLDPTYAMRFSVNMDEKNRIARAASAYIYEGDNIMLLCSIPVLLCWNWPRNCRCETIWALLHMICMWRWSL